MKYAPLIYLLFALHLLLPTISYADLYSWNNEHRPPISLQEALNISREMLKEHGEVKYCSGVSLFGNSYGNGKAGAWTIDFIMKDGRTLYCYLNMEGEKSVKEGSPWTPSETNKPALIQLADLKDLQNNLMSMCLDRRIDVSSERTKDSVTASYKPRQYEVYDTPIEKAHPKLRKEFAPKKGGFWLHAEFPEKSNSDYWYSTFLWRTQEKERPYWLSLRGIYTLSNESKPIMLELRVPYSMRDVHSYGRRTIPQASESTGTTNEIGLVVDIIDALDLQGGWGSRAFNAISWDKEETPSLAMIDAVSLADSYVRKRKLDAYCTGDTYLFKRLGGKKGEGAWQFIYWVSNKEMKLMTVQLDRKVYLHDLTLVNDRYFPMPKNAAMRDKIPQTPITISEAKARVEMVARMWDVESQIDVGDDWVTVAYKTAHLKVYEWSDDISDFMDDQKTVETPLPDGLFMKITSTGRSSSPPSEKDSWKYPSYYESYRTRFPSKDERKYIEIEGKYGRDGVGMFYDTVRALGRPPSQ